MDPELNPKPDVHAKAAELRVADRLRHEFAKHSRLERHSGDGRRIRDGPKKNGAGRFNWGLQGEL